MSITLKVEEYCQNCRSFDPSIANRRSICCGDQEEVITVVGCKVSQRCQCMYKDLERKMIQEAERGL